MSDIRCKTQGYSDGEAYLCIAPGIWQCGEIRDGVAISFEENGKWSGGFVISFEDFERAYLAAKEIRDE